MTFLFAGKFEQTFIMMLNRLLSTKRKPVSVNQRVVVETIVLTAWYLVSVHHNCALVVRNAKIKRSRSMNGPQDYRDS